MTASSVTASSVTASSVTVLDGGMGRELLRIGAPFRQPEWSALALTDAPERVLEAHRNFIDAGADVITTNTYAVVPFHIGPDRFVDEGRRLVELAAQLARRAADEAERPVRVAGGLSPLFGSYEPERFDPLTAPDLYRPIVEGQAPFVDLWMIETMSSVAEARAAVDAIRARSGEERRPIWVAFCLPESTGAGPDDPVIRLRSGEPIADLVDAVGPNVDALLINCSEPETIAVALPSLRRLVPDHVAIGAYANTFVPRAMAIPANDGISERRDELTPDFYADVVDDWVRAGASIVGGCCGIYPDHIAELARRHGTGG